MDQAKTLLHEKEIAENDLLLAQREVITLPPVKTRFYRS
jgi:hypothetical protein